MSSVLDADDRLVPNWRTCAHLLAVCQEAFVASILATMNQVPHSGKVADAPHLIGCSAHAGLLCTLTANLLFLRTRMMDQCTQNRRYNMLAEVGGVTRKGGT